MDRAEELVSAHWDNYVGPLLTACGIEGQTYALCEFMYRSSGLHFYKHSAEDQHELARKAIAGYGILGAAKDQGKGE